MKLKERLASEVPDSLEEWRYYDDECNTGFHYVRRTKRNQDCVGPMCEFELNRPTCKLCGEYLSESEIYTYVNMCRSCIES